MSFEGRGYGYRPNRAGTRPARFSALRGAPVQLPDEWSLVEHAPPVFDQGPTGSCTAHAKITATMTSATAQGTPLAFIPSPLRLYQIALCLDRGLDHRGELPPLEDIGAEPAIIEQAIRSWGIVPMGPRPADGRFSDCDPERLAVDPPLLVLEQSAHTLIAGDYQIHAFDPVPDLRRAIVQDCPVNLGFWADRDFDDWKAGDAPLNHQDREDPSGGWHYATILGFWNGYFRLRNSWGEGWGDRGECWVGESWVRSCVGIYASQVTEVST